MPYGIAFSNWPLVSLSYLPIRPETALTLLANAPLCNGKAPHGPWTRPQQLFFSGLVERHCDPLVWRTNNRRCADKKPELVETPAFWDSFAFRIYSLGINYPTVSTKPKPYRRKEHLYYDLLSITFALSPLQAFFWNFPKISVIFWECFLPLHVFTTSVLINAPIGPKRAMGQHREYFGCWGIFQRFWLTR